VWWWSKHLQDENENERVRVVKIEGLASENIHDLLCEIEAQGLGTRCKNPLWIAAINPGPKEYFSEQDRDRAREILEQERGYHGQPYFMVEHEKKGWKHWHVIYSRIDAENMRTLPDGLDARVCHAASRRIENELGLEKVIGPFDRQPGTPRPPRAPQPWEMYRGMQARLDPREITAEVTELYRQSETGPAFKAALESQGYQLVTGKRGLLILDSAGNEHSLARRIDGINTKELNAFMRDVDRQALLTLDQAKAQFQERKIAGLEADRATVAHEIEWEETLARVGREKEERERQFVRPDEKDKTQKPERGAGAGSRKEKDWPIHPPIPEPIRTSPEYHFEGAAREAGGDRSYSPSKELTGMSKRIMGYVQCLWNEPKLIAEKGKTLSAVLDHEGIRLARVTKDEADRSQREAEFAKETKRFAPRYKEGEIVAVTEPTLEYRRNGEIMGELPRIHKLDQKAAATFIAVLNNPKQVQGIEATKLILDGRAEQRAANWAAIRFENATNIKDFSLKLAGKSAARTLKVGKVATRTVGKTLDAFSDAFSSLFDPVLTPDQLRQGEKAKDRREAEADSTVDFARYTSDQAQQRQQQEIDREAERQRDRERAGRDR